MNNYTLFFIPGGPWLDGKYWDCFITNYFNKYSTTRYKLINHENEYKKSITPSISEAIDHLNKHLTKTPNPKIVIAHSYGAWLALLWAKIFDSKSCVRKFIFVNMPFDQNRTQKFNEEISRIGPASLKSNEDFKKYLDAILPLYFLPHNHSLSRLECFKNVFMEGNEKLLLSPNELETLTNNLNLNIRSHFIFAENDLITGNSWKKFSIQSSIIPDCGHFPMLESPETFSLILKSLL